LKIDRLRLSEDFDAEDAEDAGWMKRYRPPGQNL